jgi:mannose-1-phosphate guanylyltransferase
VLAGHRPVRGHLLAETVAQMTRVIPADRVVVVTTDARVGQVLSTSEAARANVFLQPADRGTATDILLPTLWILCHEPEATVMVCRLGPLGYDAALLGRLGDVAVVVEEHPLWVVLLGAVPTGAATEYGWIEPGERLHPAGPVPVFRVRQFLEKPRTEVARACLAAGWLWNAFLLVAKASVLAEAARRACPSLDAHWRDLLHEAVAKEQPRLVELGYASAPTVDFSQSVLEPLPSGLAVAPLLEAPRNSHPARVTMPERVRTVPPWLLRPGYAT